MLPHTPTPTPTPHTPYILTPYAPYIHTTLHSIHNIRFNSDPPPHAHTRTTTSPSTLQLKYTHAWLAEMVHWPRLTTFIKLVAIIFKMKKKTSPILLGDSCAINTFFFQHLSSESHALPPKPYYLHLFLFIYLFIDYDTIQTVTQILDYHLKYYAFFFLQLLVSLLPLLINNIFSSILRSLIFLALMHHKSFHYPYESSWGQYPHTLLFWWHPCVLYDTLLTEYYSSVPGKI